MYSLHLMDGTVISNLKRLNPSTFELESNDSQLYFQLNNENLNLAFLNEGDMPVDMFVDYTLQNFSCFCGVIQFRLGPWDNVNRESNRERKKRKYKELMEG